MTKKKVCWKITTKCNQNCKYCFGFTNIKDLPYNDNERVLKNLKRSGITHITWTGGEAVLYPNVNKLMGLSKELGIYNKLVTNGIFLSQNNNEYAADILNILDEINLSIDSVENDINVALGKENNHFTIIKNLLEKTKNKTIKIGINTVVSKQNINKLEELGEFLNNYRITKWKFLKFMPIREKALENKELFELSEQELEDRIKQLKTFDNIEKVEYKKQNEFEKSLVVLPNADLIITRNGQDHYLGNVLNEKVIDFDNLKDKIKTIIAINNKNTIDVVLEGLEGLEYIDIIGTANDGKEAYEKIINLKPEMVFAQYNMDSMSGYDIIKNSKKELENNIPIFNLIIDSEIKEEQIDEIYDEIGNKLNALISEPISDSIINVISEYEKTKEI